MEIALHPCMPTYAGGLGVLAGDTLRSMADLGLRGAAVTLLHRKGYFAQNLDRQGFQSEAAEEWPIERFAEPLEPRVQIDLAGRSVSVRAWRYRLRGLRGGEVPVYLLDTDVEQNFAEDRRLTDCLYGGNNVYRLRQEALLGLAGVRMLRALGHDDVGRFHLNEGHAALAAVALLEETFGGAPLDPQAAAKCVESISHRCVFTTHTPVPTGHDRFSRELVRSNLSHRVQRWLEALGQSERLNMTDLALRSSQFVNGVAMRHGEVSRSMFPQYPIRSITNGVHPASWASSSFAALFDRHIPEWRSDPLSLRYAVGIPLEQIRWAHERAKQRLLHRVKKATGVELDPATFTLGFARRATAYKRPTVIFRDLDRLASLARNAGPLQLVFAGKAHPQDHEGKRLIQQVFEAAERLRGKVAVAWLPNYDLTLGKLLCAGSDAWLNTPVPPLEASGTSGMKAALNGVPSLSVLDGWWVEGCVEGVTGWGVAPDGDGAQAPPAERDTHCAQALYDKLEGSVLPCFYGDPDRYAGIMRSAIALNASFFNTHRMLLQYVHEAYRGTSAKDRGPRSGWDEEDPDVQPGADPPWETERKR
jgi:starch phosphorylase